MHISKGEIPIATLEDWKARAGPKRKTQWKAGYSAMEAARVWLQGGPKGMPVEVLSAIEESKDFGPVLEWRGEPEARLPFDKFKGEPRNTDLVIWARDANGPYIMAVEAKANEPFGPTLETVFRDALERKIENHRSNGLARLEQLALALLPPRTKATPAAARLRYQLLTACAGALANAEMKSCSRAIVLIHQFINNMTHDRKRAANKADLADFLCRLSNGADRMPIPGHLHGPYAIPGGELFNTKTALFIGIVERRLPDAP